MKPFLALAAVVVFSGCVTREDIRGIQQDLYGIQKRLESKTDDVQTSQADLANEMQSLTNNLTALQGELKDNQERTSRLMTRLDDLEVALAARMDAQIELLSGSKFVETPLPSTVFNLANTDFTRGRYAEAIRGFEDYIKKFPTGEKVPEAKLKIADSQAKLKESTKALESYDALIKQFSKDPLVPTALLRKAALLETLGQKAQAKEIYISIVKTYPHRNEAMTAQERYRTLETQSQ